MSSDSGELSYSVNMTLKVNLQLAGIGQHVADTEHAMQYEQHVHVQENQIYS